MKKEEVCALVEKIGVVPAVRVSSAEDARFAAEAVNRGGIPIVEITMTVPGACELITELVRSHPKMVVGAGTVLTTETARMCVGSGASFLTAPSFNPKMVEFAAQQGIAVFPGALTPTEVVTAWEAGSDFVKVFPCSLVGGEKYIKALKTSLPAVRLIAAGGVDQVTAEDFIVAGANAIGVGTELIPTEAIERRQAKRIQELAQRFREFVKAGRARIEPRKKAASVSKSAAPEKDSSSAA
jgi:2-dehydro-3-deoxyphosphogluconate aldolase / (4S)-4-hydroxy-2-oxoglutarate aldolase